jgi:hypothetical protein
MNKEDTFFIILAIVIALAVPVILISVNVHANLNRKANIEAYEKCLAANLEFVKENKSNFPPSLIQCRL